MENLENIINTKTLTNLVNLKNIVDTDNPKYEEYRNNIGKIIKHNAHLYITINQLELYHLTFKKHQDTLLINVLNSINNLGCLQLKDEHHTIDRTNILTPFKTTINYNCLEDFYYLLDDEVLINIKKIFEATLIKLLKPYTNGIKKQIEVLNDIKVPEQRTPEWYIQRNNMISASDSYYACKNDHLSDYNKTIKKKLDRVEQPKFTATKATLHGTLFEIVTQVVYETRFGVHIREYGCLPHPNYSYIGASPDGIVDKVNDPTSLDQISKIGRMVEIKNPVSRKITDEVPIGYFYQTQQQMAVCNLQVCDFVESSITKNEEYMSLNDMLTDKLDLQLMDELSPEDLKDFIQNHNIPLQNLANNGMEKGVLLWFQRKGDDRDENLGVLHPLDIPYEERGINIWVNKQISEHRMKGYTHFQTYFWKLHKYDIKTVLFDQNLWDNKIFPGLTYFWKDVIEKRTMSEEAFQEWLDKTSSKKRKVGDKNTITYNFI
jgi:hypothetical protein